MKKFYKNAEAGAAPGGYVIRLDGKTLKTPLQHPFILLSPSLAAEIAQEWNVQKDEIAPASMPLTQLVYTMIDKGHGSDRAAMTAEIAKYAGSDLVCYFATHPADLVARQEKAWRPLLEWMRAEHDVAFETVSGIQYINQPQEAVKKIGKLVADMDAADFTVMQAATGLFGSPVLALALLHKKINAEEAYQAAMVDEIYQLDKWGEDALARRKLDHIRAETTALVTFRDLIKSSS